MAGGVMRYDAIVIGSGVAGFAAALTLKRRKKSVLVLTKGPGASSVSSGAWDYGIIPKEGPLSLEKLSASEPWSQIKSRLLIDADNLLSHPDIESAAREIATALEPTLPLQFSFSKALVLPTSGGKWRRTFGAQKIQATADVSSLAGKKPRLVFSKNWRFPGQEICRRWNEGMPDGQRVDIQPLEIAFPMEGSDWAIPSLAARIAQPGPMRDLFETKLKEAVRKAETRQLILPPLFADLAWHAKLQKELEVTISECLATVEPTAGYRLHHAIMKTLAGLSIDVKEVKNLEVVSQGKEISAVRFAEKIGGHGEAAAGHFILATGKLFSGGIEMGYDHVTEPVFRLPLFVGRQSGPISHRGQIPWADREFHSDQTWTRLGFWLDSKWRPRNGAGEVVYENLFACGSGIGGVDQARHQVGLGFASYTGRQCVEQTA